MSADKKYIELLVLTGIHEYILKAYVHQGKCILGTLESLCSIQRK